MKKTICLLMIIVLTLCIFSSIIAIAVSAIKTMDTPIAKIPNDTYVPYANKNSEQNFNDMGLKFYSSEEDYIKEQQNYSSVAMQTTIEPIKMTIKTLDKLTNKPIPNAIIRLNGVPRYSNRDGEINVTLSQAIYEMYITKDTRDGSESYNPHIEFLYLEDYSSNAIKTVYMKRPSDDIDISSVIFSYHGENFNVLEQPCHILKNDMESYIGMQIYSNVSAERYMFLVNGEVKRLSYNNEIEFIDFTDYNESDKFAVQIYYNGILSKEIPILVFVGDIDSDVMRAEILSEVASQNNSKDLTIGNDEAGIGEAGKINFNETEVAEWLAELLVPKKLPPIHIGSAEIELQFIYSPNKGTIKTIVGVGCSIGVTDIINKHKQYKKEVDDKNVKYREWKKKKAQEREDKIVEAQNKVKECDRKIKKLQENILENGEELKTLTEQRDFFQNLIKADYNYSDPDYEETLYIYGNELKHAQGQLTELQSSLEDEYIKDYTAINNTKMDRKEPVKSLYDYLLNGKKYKNKVKSLKGVFKNAADLGAPSKGFDLDIDLKAVGVCEYSFKEKKVTEGRLYGEVMVKGSFTYQRFVPVGFVPVPFFVKIQAGAGVEVSLINHSIEEPFKPISISGFTSQIKLSILLMVRIDGGVGLDGIASAGVYGKGDFKFYLKPDIHGTFQWGAGVRLKFLIFEGEWGYNSNEIDLYGNPKSLSLIARKTETGSKISNNQVNDRLYPASQSNLVLLKDGRQLLTWIEDDSSRDAYNRYVLKYSINDNNIWSEAKAVFDNGTADFAYDIMENNGLVYLAIQKNTRNLDNTDTVTSIMADSEIYVSQFDLTSSNFNEITRITNNKTMDACPKFAIFDTSGEVMLTWKGNTVSDYFGSSGENLIYMSKLSGSGWSHAIEVYRTTNSIYSYSATNDGDNIVLAVSEDADGNMMTDDATLKIIKGGKINTIEGVCYNPSFIKKGNEIILLYIKDDKLYCTQNFTSSDILFETNEAIRNFRVNNNSGQTSIFYEKLLGDVEQVYCAFYENGEWVKDILVTEENNADNNISYSIGYKQDDKIYTAYNISDKDGEMALCYYVKEIKANIEISAYAPNGIEENRLSNIRLRIANIGDCDVKKVNIRICGQNYEITCEPVLTLNTERYFDLDFFAVLNGGSSIHITAQVMDEQKNVIAESEYELKVLYTELAVKFSMIIKDGKQMFQVAVENISQIATNAKVFVYLNDRLYNEVSVYFNSYDRKELVFTFDEIKEGDSVYIAVVPEEEEYNLSDNYESFISIQTESIIIEQNNPYLETLKVAKQLMGGIA